MSKNKTKTKPDAFSVVLWSVLAGVFALLFVVMTISSVLVPKYAGAALNMVFGTSNTKTVYDENDKAVDFYETSYDFERNNENLFREDSAMIEEAEAAGAVLLWNKTEGNSGALPLVGNEKVSLFGHAAVDITECGTGSGYVRTYDYNAGRSVTVTMKDAFESRGFTVNDKLWDFYTRVCKDKKYQMIEWDKTICKEWREWYVKEVPQSVFTDVEKRSYSEFGDVAVVMLARSGGEYSDLHYNYTSATDFVGKNDRGEGENTSANGGYLGLSKEEKDLLAAVTNGGFRKVVVLLNTGNPLQMQDFEPYMDKIDACMWIGQPGSTGINAVVDLLKGKDMNGKDLVPSGRLPDTWAYDNNSAPASVNDGNYQYRDYEKYSKNTSLGTIGFWSKYMVYQEGIYVGYRYYETRYADCIEGKGNATASVGSKHSGAGNAWNYNSEVAFPFGYGTSYTEFEYSGFSVERDDDKFIVKVTVTNNGAYDAREAVQVYLQKPYTAYDVANGIEKSAIELCGYTKTGVLAKGGGREEVTVEVPLSAFKTYDANGEGTYIIEGSDDYYLTVGTDSHVALNNILSAKSKSPAAQEVLGGAANTKPVSLGAAFAKKISLEEDYRTFAKSEHTGEYVENQLDSGDINKYVNRGSNSVKYLTRNDWTSFPQSNAVLSVNDDMIFDLRFDKDPGDTGDDMPDEKMFVSGSNKPDVKNGDVVAYMFMEAPLYPEREKDNTTVYEDGLVYSKHWEKMWDQLLDQMSFEEQALLVANSYHLINGAASIALPSSKQENGPVGITKREEAIFSLPNDEKIKGSNGTGWTWVAYPCAGILAASFDDDIARRVGEHKSEDMLYLGYNGIYGPGVNLHRSPFGGRAFEYPSEDPYLAGYIEAAECIGIESKGCMAYAKHYALNDMETNRVNCGVWSNEQASRELYLRAFEIVFTVGKASATMNSFTRIGTTWNGASYAMMTTILRDEWGYDGLVISDWVTGGSAMSAVDGVMAGTDTFDGNWDAGKFKPYENNAAVRQALRLAAKRVIYNVVRTNAMNGITVNTRVVPVMPWWQQLLWGITWTFFVIMLASGAMLAVSLVFKFKKKPSAQTASAETTVSADESQAASGQAENADAPTEHVESQTENTDSQTESNE